MLMPYLECCELVEAYREILKAAQEQKLTLKDPEVRQAWNFFKQLLAMKRRIEVDMLYQPHLHN